MMKHNAPLRALIVDAEEIHRKGMALALGEFFPEIESTDNPVRAAQLIRERYPDVIITDINFKTADGMRSLQLFHDLAPQAVLFIVSAHFDKHVEEQVQKIGIHSVWEKPIDLEEFKKHVGRIVCQMKERLRR